MLTIFCESVNIISVNATVAQLDRVFGYEPNGRGFESLRLHQSLRAMLGHQKSLGKPSDFFNLRILSALVWRQSKTFDKSKLLRQL